MAKGTEVVSWTQFGIVGGLLVGAIAIGFAWIHGDLSDLKSEIRDTRKEMTQAIGEVAKQAAATNSRLDLLIEETKKHR